MAQNVTNMDQMLTRRWCRWSWHFWRSICRRIWFSRRPRWSPSCSSHSYAADWERRPWLWMSRVFFFCFFFFYFSSNLSRRRFLSHFFRYASAYYAVLKLKLKLEGAGCLSNVCICIFSWICLILVLVLVECVNSLWRKWNRTQTNKKYYSNLKMK